MKENKNHVVTVRLTAKTLLELRRIADKKQQRAVKSCDKKERCRPEPFDPDESNEQRLDRQYEGWTTERGMKTLLFAVTDSLCAKIVRDRLKLAEEHKKRNRQLYYQKHKNTRRKNAKKTAG